MKQSPIPDRCKTCRSLWTGGVKDGKHDRWCTHFGQAAPKIEPHCRTVGGYVAKDSADGKRQLERSC